jgi:hypothetical protein
LTKIEKHICFVKLRQAIDGSFNSYNVTLVGDGRLSLSAHHPTLHVTELRRVANFVSSSLTFFGLAESLSSMTSSDRDSLFLAVFVGTLTLLTMKIYS